MQWKQWKNSDNKTMYDVYIFRLWTFEVLTIVRNYVI